MTDCLGFALKRLDNNNTQTPTHTDTYTQSHTHRHTDTHTDTRTQTHKYTQIHKYTSKTPEGANHTPTTNDHHNQQQARRLKGGVRPLGFRVQGFCFFSFNFSCLWVFKGSLHSGRSNVTRVSVCPDTHRPTKVFEFVK